MVESKDLERRAYPRVPIRDSIVVVLSPDKIVSFRVLDVSKSGISFSYNSRGLDTKLMGEAVLDLFGEKIGAIDLPVKIISDVEIDNALVWFTNTDNGAAIPYLRKCGVSLANFLGNNKLR